jgi:hypothetical protein
VTEESDLHSEKHSSPKTSTDAGTLTNSRPVFLNDFDSVPSNFDSFSITTDLMDSFPETLSEEINLIGEGSHQRHLSAIHWWGMTLICKSLVGNNTSWQIIGGE